MWGDWMEKAKNVAANIDKQINESVGIDDDGALVSATVPVEEENVWNDDFDDQAFDDDPIHEEEQKSAPPQPIAQQPTSSEATDNKHTIQDKPTPDVQIENSVPSVSAIDANIPHDAGVSKSLDEPEPDAVNEGWEKDDVDAFDISESQDEVVDFQKPSPSPADSTPAEIAEAATANPLETASSMFSSLSSSAAPMSSFFSSTAAAASSAGPMSSILQSTVGVLDKVAQSSSRDEQEPSSDSVPGVPKAEDSPKPVDKSVQEDSGVEEPIATSSGDDGWEGDVLMVAGVDEDVAGDNETKQLEPVSPKDESEVEKAKISIDTPKETTTEPTTAEVAPSSEAGEATSVPETNPTPVEKPADVPAEDSTEQPGISVEEDVATPTIPVEENVTTLNSHAGATSVVQTQFPLNIEEDPRYKKLLEQLKLREDQLASKSEQLTELQGLWETQEQELRQKIQDTKDEAKKRVLKAKERCEVAEAKLKQQTSAKAESGTQQDQLIAALRQEGENLARKQSEMEKAVRSAKAESRGLAEQLEGERAAKEQALEKISKLENELKETKGSLSSARKGESQVGKLENDLLAARSDAEMKAATIMSLEQQIKELKAEAKELNDGILSTQKGAEESAERESKKLRREHNDAIADLETKLRTSEREAGVREDALRHEVSELRKRWQDAVRRADALSMDVQSSTAPLLRQLESMERQNRARASAWAELENKLRSELEETVIQNEKISKERSELKTKFTRLDRAANERETELTECRSTIDSLTAKVTKLEGEIEERENDTKKLREDYEKVERLANEGVARVRSEMTQTVVDSEERYRGQIEKLEGELGVEREKRTQLENQVGELLDNAGMIVAPQAPQTMLRESKPKKLRGTERQSEILAGALGFGESDDELDDDNDSHDGDEHGNDQNGGMSSFAALEQLSSRLKIAKAELETLRANLRESERVRNDLVSELADSRQAKERLPLFEARVKELTDDNREKELEIQGLRYDITEVRELYRAQLNVLLEEKASSFVASSMNGGSAPSNDAVSKQPEPDNEAANLVPTETAVTDVADAVDAEESELN